MRIVIFNWRDLNSPKAGGAEVSTDRLARGLAERGHTVTWFTSRHANSKPFDKRGGYQIVRFGTEITCRLYAFRWLRKNTTDVDVIIDEVNTLPFFSRYTRVAPVVLWMHQIAKEVWLAEAPFVLGLVGYLSEPLLLKPYRDSPAIAVSKSTAASLRSMGLRGEITVAENALQPPASFGTPAFGRIGYVGRVTASKRIEHIIRAFSLVRQDVPEAELFIVGAGDQRDMRRLQMLANRLNVGKAVIFTGRLSTTERDVLVASLDVITMASLREGWGLVISEAARFGVPSAVYPVAGLIDSVQHLTTGLIAANQTPSALAAALRQILCNRELRDNLGRNAMQYIKRFDHERFVSRCEAVLQGALRR